MWSSRPSRAEPDSSQPDGAMQFAPVQLVDVVSSVVQELDESGQRVQIVIERAPTVLADFRKLAEVTTKLISNAMESTPDDGLVEVAISGACLEHNAEGESRGSPSEEPEPCAAAVSVAVRGASDDTEAPSPDDTSRKPLPFVGADHIMRRHKGRLWVTTRQDRKTLGFCLNAGQAA